MSKQTGMGTMSFGATVLVWKAEDGITEDGPIGVAADCTPDGATANETVAGDVTNHATVGATVLADDTVNVEALVNTTAVLTVTYPLGTNSTAKTKTGSAICTLAARSSVMNVVNTYAVSFTWATAPVIVDATV